MVPSILYIDDEAAARASFVQLMLKQGYAVDTTRNATEATSLALTQPYSVVVIDSIILNANARNLLERLRTSLPLAVMIVVTDRGAETNTFEYERDGTVAFVINKPWSEQELILKLHDAFEQQRARVLDSAGRWESQPMDREPTILLIEDDASVAFHVRSQLAGSGSTSYSAHQAESVVEAMQMLRRNHYAAIICGIHDDEQSEYGVIRKLRSWAPDIPIIVLGDDDDELTAFKMVSYGAQDYLIKHKIDRFSLHRAINHALERKRAEHRMAQLAHSDQLTGLVNRFGFRDRLARGIQRAALGDSELGLLLLDLNSFRNINSNHGIQSGDSILRHVALKLREQLQDAGTIARLGGNEFGIVVEGSSIRAKIVDVSRRLLRAFDTPVEIHGDSTDITGCIGAAVYPSGGETIDEMLKSASSAVDSAKRIGPNSFSLFTADTRRRTEAQLRIEKAVRISVRDRKDDFVIFYQPLFDFQQRRPIAVEALIRWKDPVGMIVPPDSFIPHLEDNGLIAKLGSWVLEKGCCQLRKWHEEGAEDLRLTVNISAKQFESNMLIPAVEHALRKSRLDPGFLELEITETMLMRDIELAAMTLQRFKAMGVRIAVDDFGTGYSSLAYLDRFALDVLKIDRSFVGSIGTGRNDGQIASAVIGLGHKMGLEVVAEGIETQAQYDFLEREGCDIGQGFLLGRPSPEWSPSKPSGLAPSPSGAALSTRPYRKSG